jgi:voltage-gated potassium channel
VGPINIISIFRHPEFKQLRLALFFIVLVISSGTLGYKFIENYPTLDAFYMTVITVGTVGFMEVHPLSDGGKIFTAILILLSLGTFAYGISAITSAIVEGQIAAYFSGYKLKTEISHLNNHVIVCGYGRNGKQACRQLKTRGVHFVVIERDEAICEGLREDGQTLYIHGDASDDKFLELAGIYRAKALISTLDQDTNNLFVVLSARSLNAKLQIISRASEEGSGKKLYIAGANNVIMPDKIGGAHMAALISRPDVLEFLDLLASSDDDSGAHLEELLNIKLKESYQNKTISALKIHELTGVSIIGIQNSIGEFTLNPPINTVITDNMKLFVLGSYPQINHLKKEFFLS